MRLSVSIVIPAWNEQQSIGATLEGLHRLNGPGNPVWDEIVVVDDGSWDETFAQSKSWATKVIRHPVRKGKGAALETGWKNTTGDIVMFLDADLGASVQHAPLLLEPIYQGSADMVIAHIPPRAGSGGFGLVKKLASFGIYRLSGFRPLAPLSGQRAVLRKVLTEIERLSGGFGIEVGLTIDAARKG